MYYNRIKIMSDDGGSLVDVLEPMEETQNGTKSGELVIGDEPQTPKPIVEIHLCPICLHKCEGSAELLEHYWGYCQKTRTYYDRIVE